MNAYTPTTEAVRDRWGKMTHLRAEFDRWLAAHDAQVRAAALAEQDDAQVERIARLLARTSEFTQTDARVLVKAAQDIAAAEQGTEEPDWEWALMADGDDEPWSNYYKTREHLAERCGGLVDRGDEHLVRRRAPGPWMPVEQGDE